MTVLESSQTVSLAHRSKGGLNLGRNLRVKLAVAVAAGEFAFEPLQKQVKARLDHQFLEGPTTLEAVTELLAADLFQQPLAGARWVSVEMFDLDRMRCTVEPGGGPMRVEIRHRNLTLEMRGPIDPAQAAALVDQVFAGFEGRAGESDAQWGERLFITLKKLLPTLESATVDLGRHRSVRLAQGPQPLR